MLGLLVNRFCVVPVYRFDDRGPVLLAGEPLAVLVAFAELADAPAVVVLVAEPQAALLAVGAPAVVAPVSCIAAFSPAAASVWSS